MRCEDLELLIEAIADGSHSPSSAETGHIASCAVCRDRIEQARAIERLLASRIVDAPSPSFTIGVMLRVGQERWQAERVIDLGFNLAMLAGLLVIVAGAAGLAWSLGMLSVTIDLEALLTAGADLTGRVFPQAQTVMLAAVLLTTALGLWWWAETAAD